MNIEPGMYELLVALTIGISGISLGLLAGIRHPLLLVPFALAGSVTIRVVTALTLWTLDLNSWTLEVWALVSILVALAGVTLWFRFLKVALLSLGLWSAFIITALTAKYIARIGEMQHSDSAGQVALSLLVIQSDSDDLSQLSAAPKRGIAFPLMLALGPGGRIFSIFPVLVFLATASLVAWLTLRITEEKPRRFLFAAWGVVGLFSISVPMFRISAFYLNSHTLMGLGVALLTTGVFLNLRSGASRLPNTALIVTGALIGSTARIEGIILVSLILGMLASQAVMQKHSRLTVAIGVASAGGLLSWWIGVLDSPVIEKFGLQWWWLPLLTALGAILLPSPIFDSLRQWIPQVLGGILLFLLIREVWTSGNPVATATAQVPNLIFGEGGWSSAAILFVILTLLSVKANLSKDYLWFLGVSWLSLAAVLFSKTFDGGFGRESFYDSVNRMILHVAPLVAVTTIVAITEMFGRALKNSPTPAEIRRQL